MNRALRSPLLGVFIALIGVAMLVVGLRGSRGFVAWGAAWLFAGVLIAVVNWRHRAKLAARDAVVGGIWPPENLPGPDTAHSAHHGDGLSSVGDGGGVDSN